MHALEKTVFAIRHHKYLERADSLWDLVRPIYERLSARAAPAGLERIINGTDTVFVSTRCRNLTETYEPEVWQSIMAEVRSGDAIADIGAFIGLYTVALAKRVGAGGRVFGFEPDKSNFEMLQEHVRLNQVEPQVKLLRAAAGSLDCQLNFVSDGSESHVSFTSDTTDPGIGSSTVMCQTLDTVLANSRVDMIKIDVEGYEEMVLRGGSALLSDPERRPRAIFIEVHPYAWPAVGTSGESLLSLLKSHGYRVVDLAEKQLDKITEYGEVIARIA